MPEETYLGDGVYASYDGYQIWVRVDDGSRIALESRTLDALIKYRADLVAKLRRAAAASMETGGE